VKHVVLAVILLFVIVPTLPAQTSPGSMRELIDEVRALRTAVEQSVTLGTRAQMVVARIQLQEQRIADLSRRASALKADLKSADLEVSEYTNRLEAFEADISAMPSGEARQKTEEELARSRRRLEILERHRQSLTNDEATVMQQIATEQGRWTDATNELADLERLLTPKKPR
jgi:chromosome segregation ATPase